MRSLLSVEKKLSAATLPRRLPLRLTTVLKCQRTSRGPALAIGHVSGSPRFRSSVLEGPLFFLFATQETRAFEMVLAGPPKVKTNPLRINELYCSRSCPRFG